MSKIIVVFEEDGETIGHIFPYDEKVEKTLDNQGVYFEIHDVESPNFQEVIML